MQGDIMSMFNLGGFVKSLVSHVVTKLHKFILGNSELGIPEICTPKVIFKTVLRGFIEHKIINGITQTVIDKIYCDGELVTGEININTLKDNTFLVSAIGVNGAILQIVLFKVIAYRNALRLEEVNLGKKDIPDYLIIAINNISVVCCAGVCHSGDGYYILHD
jgi:hypothetical protein